MGCDDGKEDVVDALLEANADQNVCGEDGTTPLMMASIHGNSPIVQKLLQCNADINKGDQHDATALWYACNNGKEDVVDALLDANADPNICSVNGMIPLMMASEIGYS